MGKSIQEYSFFKQLMSIDLIEEIWLFGSRARGDSQDRSDIDLAILSPRATDKDWAIIMAIIDDADTLLKIDCIRLDKEKISAELYGHIIKDKKVIYAKNSL